MTQGTDCVKLPCVVVVATRGGSGGGGGRPRIAGPGGVAVADDAKGGNGAEEDVADAPEDRPLLS